MDLQCYSVDPVDATSRIPSREVGPVALVIGSDADALTRCSIGLDCGRGEHDWVYPLAEVSFPCLTQDGSRARHVYELNTPKLAAHELDHVRICIEEVAALNARSPDCASADAGRQAALDQVAARGDALDILTNHGRRAALH